MHVLLSSSLSYLPPFKRACVLVKSTTEEECHFVEFMAKRARKAWVDKIRRLTLEQLTHSALWSVSRQNERIGWSWRLTDIVHFIEWVTCHWSNLWWAFIKRCARMNNKSVDISQGQTETQDSKWIRYRRYFNFNLLFCFLLYERFFLCELKWLLVMFT